jgi:hypothetical protein
MKFQSKPNHHAGRLKKTGGRKFFGFLSAGFLERQKADSKNSLSLTHFPVKEGNALLAFRIETKKKSCSQPFFKI